MHRLSCFRDGMNDRYTSWDLTAKPCGDPPAFPHTLLYGHTGFEMGDELLYVCYHGYEMGKGESAFTLLCDSYGKWYGHVHACVKDETEAFIDYEDNFNDDNDMPYFELDTEEDDYDDDNHLETHDFFFDIDQEQKAHMEDPRDLVSVGKVSKRPTESPISILSERHLFQFPTEEINGPQSEMDLHQNKKTDYNEQKNREHLITKDVSVHSSVMNNSKTNTSIDNSEHYIEPQIIDNKNVDDSVETISSVNFHRSDEINNGDAATFLTNTGMNGMFAAFPTPPFGNSQEEGQLKSSTLPGGKNSSEINSNYSMQFHPSNITLDDTSTTLSSIQGVTKSNPTVGYHNVKTEARQLSGNIYDVVIHSTPSELDLTMSQYPRRLEEDNSEETQMYDTVQPCLGDDCLQVSNDQLIVIIMITICLLLFSIIISFWCYKKKQQISVFSLNGTTQTNQAQRIEMQKI
uniref:Sushi domain-containing protein n=1 Tax=Leptobrachium leishanense TaxID=445787 RepID=A0A8C5PUB1_9ANUR